MPDYSSLSDQISQFKTAATALMNSGTLDANDLALVGNSLNSIANALGVADINQAVVDSVASVEAARDAAITAFNSGTNGTRLTIAEADIDDLQARTTNIEGFVDTNSAQYSTLQSTVSSLQTSLSTVPSQWEELAVSATLLNNDRVFVTSGGITVTLPLNPSIGYAVHVVDATGAAATTNFTIARNSQKIMGLNEDLVVNVNGASALLTYVNATRGWVLV
ncbi:MAG: hypothetical protein ACO3DP_01120 [Candidatus Nanopelagicaceae bacterium]